MARKLFDFSLLALFCLGVLWVHGDVEEVEWSGSNPCRHAGVHLNRNVHRRLRTNTAALVKAGCGTGFEATSVTVYLNASSVYSFNSSIAKTDSVIDQCLDDCSCKGFTMSDLGYSFLTDYSSLPEGESYYAVKANCSRNILDEFLFVPGYNFGYNDIFNIENIFDINDCKNECAKVCNCSLVGLDPYKHLCWLKTGMYDLVSGLTNDIDEFNGDGWQSLIRKCGENFTANFLKDANADYEGNTYRSFPNLRFHLCRFACASDCDCVAFVIDPDKNCLLKSGMGERKNKSGNTVYLRQSIDVLNMDNRSSSENLLINPGFDYTSLYFTKYPLNLTSNLSSFVYGWDLIDGQVNVHFGEQYPIDNYLSLCTLGSSAMAQITQSFPTEPGIQYSLKFSSGMDTLVQGSMTVQVNIAPSTNGSTTFEITSTLNSIKGPILFVAEESSTDLILQGPTQGCVKVDNIVVTKLEVPSSIPDTVPQSSNPPSPSNSKSSNNSKIVIISIVVSLVLVFLVIACIYCSFRKNKTTFTNYILPVILGAILTAVLGLICSLIVKVI